MLILITDVCLVSIFVDAQSLEACIFHFLSPLLCHFSPSQGRPRSEIHVLLSLSFTMARCGPVFIDITLRFLMFK